MDWLAQIAIGVVFIGGIALLIDVYWHFRTHLFSRFQLFGHSYQVKS